MGQIWFQSTLKDQIVEVLTGWDPPLQRFFVTVFILPDEDEAIVDEYSTQAHDMCAILHKLKINYPKELLGLMNKKHDGSTVINLHKEDDSWVIS